MNKEQILELFKEDIKLKRNKIRHFLTDPSIPYEDKVNIWKECPEFLAPSDNSIISLPEFEDKYGEISWVDDFYCERYETVDLRICAEQIENVERKDAFIRACINEGICQFYFNW